MHISGTVNPAPARRIPGPPAVLAILLILAFICIPACGISISATISTEPPARSVPPLSEYIQAGQDLRAEGNWEGLIHIMDEGLAFYPDDPGLLCLKGYGLRKTSRFQESVDTVSRAIQLDPEPVRYANRGIGLLAMGRPQDALLDAESAISLNSSYPTAYGLKAMALLALGNLTGAEQSIETAISLDPENAHYWHIRGNILAQAGDCAAAVQSLQRSIGIDPNYDLPWPGLPNATVDLQRTEEECKAPPASPAPPQPALPAVLVIVAGIVAVWVIRR